MKTIEMNEPDFDTMEELYKFIDNNALSLDRKFNLTDLLIKYQNKSQHDPEKQFAKWELECSLLNLRSNQVFSFAYSSGKDPGDFYRYPNLDEFQQAAFDYIKKRAQTTKSPLLKAIYNHLLWRGPQRNKASSVCNSCLEKLFNCY